MGLVTVKVNGRDFSLSCEDGQEPRIRRLAQLVESRVAEFAANLGQVGDARLILLAALVLADELAETSEALQRARSASTPSAEAPAAAAESIRGIAERIEAVAARHRTP
jgi:cell division protein ZapA